jgi:hypothetical protein
MQLKGAYLGLLLSGLPSISPFIGNYQQMIHRNGTIELSTLSLPKDILSIKKIIDMIIFKRAEM